MLVVAQRCQRCVGDTADAHLQSGTVRDELCDMLANLHFLWQQTLAPVLEDGLVHMHDRIELGVVDHAISIDAGHPRIHKAHHVLAVFNRTPGPVHGGAQGAEAMLVRRGDVDERELGLHDAAAKEQRQLAQVHGDVQGITLLDLFAQVRAHERGQGSDALCGLGIPQRLRPLALEVHVDGAHPAQLLGLRHLDHAADKHLGSGTTGLDEDHAAGLEKWLHGLGSRLANYRCVPQAEGHAICELLNLGEVAAAPKCPQARESGTGRAQHRCASTPEKSAQQGMPLSLP
mmetsp:Transcript_29609/g.68852  ORF Transcript_29609/g.68852 Transcript_29609/m.68852 type:complete len:288 (+) Transcript_29609:830-1693(+)